MTDSCGYGPAPAFAYGKLPAADLERARHFYAGTLGLHPFDETDGHLYYDVRGCRFMLFASSGVASGTHDQLGFVVADLAAAVDSCRSTGLRFLDTPVTQNGIANFGPIRAAWFHDSEGNLINLIEGSSPLWSK
jgi:catechol 2,3-dioxygenase-like lactoylglutathione lyase family enzyme